MARSSCIDLIKLRDKIGEEAVVGYWELTLERRTKPVQIVLGKEAHSNYSIVGQCIHSNGLHNAAMLDSAAFDAQ